MRHVSDGIGRAALSAYRGGTRVRDKVFSLLVRKAFAGFGNHTVIQLPVRLEGASRIAVGSDVFVGSGSWLQVLSDDSTGVALSLGDGTSIAGSCVLSAARSISVGRGVLFARNVYVSDHSHAFEDTTRPVLAQGVDRIQPVTIEDGAWLGQNVVVCPGVRIGRGAVIGANAVVTDDVADFAVAVGAPARTIRQFEMRPLALAAAEDAR